MNDWAEFRHFLYLKTILERGGFRSAADHLNTSQPNLTVQARQFQDFADISLYRKAKDDQCLDGACYQAKVEAHIQRELAARPELVQIQTAWRQPSETGPDVLNKHQYRELPDPDNPDAEPPCPSARPAIIVYGKNVGRTVTVCLAPRCAVHTNHVQQSNDEEEVELPPTMPEPGPYDRGSSDIVGSARDGSQSIEGSAETWTEGDACHREDIKLAMLLASEIDCAHDTSSCDDAGRHGRTKAFALRDKSRTVIRGPLGPKPSVRRPLPHASCILLNETQTWENIGCGNQTRSLFLASDT